jgi:hypothetical protein
MLLNSLPSPMIKSPFIMEVPSAGRPRIPVCRSERRFRLILGTRAAVGRMV